MSTDRYRSAMTFKEVLSYAAEIEELYDVRIRFGCYTLARAGSGATHAITVTAHHRNGKKVVEVDQEQALWPGGTSKTREGAEIYLLTRLASALDEWRSQEKREEEQAAPLELTPLENYIKGSF